MWFHELVHHSDNRHDHGVAELVIVSGVRHRNPELRSARFLETHQPRAFPSLLGIQEGRLQCEVRFGGVLVYTDRDTQTAVVDRGKWLVLDADASDTAVALALTLALGKCGAVAATSFDRR